MHIIFPLLQSKWQGLDIIYSAFCLHLPPPWPIHITWNATVCLEQCFREHQARHNPLQLSAEEVFVDLEKFLPQPSVTLYQRKFYIQFSLINFLLVSATLPPPNSKRISSKFRQFFFFLLKYVTMESVLLWDKFIESKANNNQTINRNEEAQLRLHSLWFWLLLRKPCIWCGFRAIISTRMKCILRKSDPGIFGGLGPQHLDQIISNYWERNYIFIRPQYIRIC